MRFLRWLRQLVCVHGPYENIDIGHGYDTRCTRCGWLRCQTRWA